MAYMAAMDFNSKLFDGAKHLNTGSIQVPSDRTCQLLYNLYYATHRAFPALSLKALITIYSTSPRLLLHDEILQTLNDIGITNIQENVKNLVTTATSAAFNPAPQQVKQLADINLANANVFNCIRTILTKKPEIKLTIDNLLTLSQEIAKLSKV
jgi:hypothetical protein